MTTESPFDFSFFLKWDFHKKMIKKYNRLLLWNQIQNDNWKSFSFSLNCDFQKKIIKSDSSALAFHCKAKPKWRHFHFIELWLSKIATLELESKTKMTDESSFHFVGLRLLLLIFDAKRKVMCYNRLTETHEILIVGFLPLLNYLLLFSGEVCSFGFKIR